MKTRIVLLFTLLLIVNVVLIAQAPEWQWATQAGGGNNNDDGYAITIDDAGNSYVTGCFEDTATFGSYSLISSGNMDIFVAKIDAIGNWLWATRAGGTSYDYGLAITIDNTGNSYVTGYFESTATFGSYSLTSSGGADIFLAKMDDSGNWLWATKAGGTYGDCGYGITIDNAGNSYVTGDFLGTATFGSYSLTSSSSEDIFVAKMDAIGNWQWATRAGGTGEDMGLGITIDNASNSYVTGIFIGTATFGSYTLTSSGLEDIFVAKMDADGIWQWVNKAGGDNWDGGNAIKIDDSGNSYVTGYFNETATFGSYSLTSSNSQDIFVAKMDNSGNWQWATRAGGTGDDCGYGITIDNAGNSYVIGSFGGTATFGSHYLTSNGGSDIFVAKLNSSVFAENEIIPIEMELSNYPNPFNPSTTISFSLTAKDAKNAKIEIYNLKGQNIKKLEIRNLKLGINEVVWDGKDENNQPVGSGIYFYKLKTDNFEKTRKMILIK